MVRSAAGGPARWSGLSFSWERAGVGSLASCFLQCVHRVVLFCLFSQSFLQSVPPPAVSCLLYCPSPVLRGPAVPHARPAASGVGGEAVRGDLARGGEAGLGWRSVSDSERSGARSAWAGCCGIKFRRWSPLPAARPGLEARFVSVNRESAFLPLSPCLPGPVQGC